MTPKEIVERVKTCVQGGRDYCRLSDIPEPTTIQHCSDIDHLLAIHAAAVEVLESERALLDEAWKNLSDRTTWDACTIASQRRNDARANFAALCGWKAEEGV